jgi:HTH-type transcriptional regulator / antitoxin HigA
MAENQDFQPDWASTPGDTIVDILEERNLSPAEFAHRMGYSIEQVHELLHGRVVITIEIARKLEGAIGGSATFWMLRDSQYRDDVARLNRGVQGTGGAEWLHELPLKDMLKFGWLGSVSRSGGELAACLRFFGVNDVETWRESYRDVLEMAAFRTSPTFASQPAAVAAWLRRGEIESESINCETWDAQRFQEILSAIRSLTRRKDPNLFIPELKKRCAECGVAVAIVRAPAGCRASGATRFLSLSKALLLLSFRYLSDDHFWFTFFHEAGHLLLHGKKVLFLEGAGMSSTREEEEANDFAARTLVPPEFRAALFRLRADGREVIRFARQIGVSPGIVVGQLQHLKRIRRNQLNNLKRRYSWGDE